ncbi:MAG: hypothetical protein ABR899_03090 [Candidatus Krumholzibacteriaceae bacterium]
MKRTARIRGFAPLLAALLLGGCVRNDVVQPEGTNILWEEVAYTLQHQITCMAIDPGGRIFLGTYDYRQGFSLSESVLYVSSDNGETWVKNETGDFDMEGLAVDSEGRLLATDGRRIIRSLDHGETWEAPSLNLYISGGLAFVVDSSDDIYVWTAHSGIYFSSDHGGSWTQIGGAITAAGQLISLAVSSKGCLYAVAGETLYSSCDRGASWTELQDVPWDELYGQVAIDSKDRIFVNDLFTLYVYSSTDDGKTWTAHKWPPNWWIDQLSIDGRGRLYAECNSRLYVSDDGGDSWALALSLKTCYLHQFASNAAGDMFAAGYWGLSRSIDNGATWEMLGFSYYPAADIAVDRTGLLYTGLQCGGVYRSTGDLQSPERFSTGLPDVRLYCLASAGDSTLMAGTSGGVYISPEDRPAWSLAGPEGNYIKKLFALPGDSIAAFGKGMFISADGGKNWSEIGLDGYNVLALVRTAGGRLLAGANFGGVFRYTGQGILWDQMNGGLSDLRVNALAVTRNGDILAGTDTGIFISSNEGASWRRYSKEKTQITNVLVVGKDVFFGSEEGVLWTRTDGSAISLQNGGLSPIDISTVRAIAADPRDYLFLFTARGVFKSSQPTKELSPSGI